MLRGIVSFLALFSSLSTLFCCALPALLVMLGLGASLASFLGSYPQLIWFSEHKGTVFLFAGFMLFATALMRRYSASQSCPTDEALRNTCGKTRSVSSWIFYSSVTLYFIGGFFAFVAPLLNEY